MEYLIAKWLHILSSTLLFGTGLGSAYYMFFASRTKDPQAVAVVVRYVVLADWLFTATTVVFQPLSGFYMAHLAHLPLSTGWIFWSLLLYLLAGACWLPVVWMQIRMRRMAEQAVRDNGPLPALYFRLLRWWTALGVPAFFALVIVFWLMVAKPS
ncbi:MAG TPA: DUF2269 domain-containing protein [Albitalea sp.]|nr:DUF2269 domain-containing protein [Albitalea sp.]